MSVQLTPAMRRSVLISMLRDESQWPEGFRWSYTCADGCAIGLMEERMDMFSADDWDKADALGLNHRAFDQIFNAKWGLVGFVLGQNDFLYPPRQFVTPEMVADRLEAVHKKLGRGLTR